MTRSVSTTNTLLLISSQKTLIKKLTEIVSSQFPEYTLEVADSGVKGLTRIYQSPPTVILVDSTLSDISGLQICRILKHDPTIRKVPIMLITRDEPEEYQRFSELSTIADVFLESKHLLTQFSGQFKMLVSLYTGLDDAECSQLRLIQQEPVQVQAVTRMAQLFDQSITEVAVLKGFRKLFELVQNKNVLHHMFFGLLEAALDYDIAAVFFNDKNREPRHLAFHVAHNFEISEGQFEVWTQEIFENLQAKAAEPWLFKSTRYEVIQAEYMVEGKPLSIKQQLVVPFELEGEMVGAIAFFNRKEINYDIIFPYNLLMQEISVLMRLRRYFSEAEMLAISDPLTGLYTHQHFLWCLEREIRQAKRHKTPLTLVNISVEDIREMNAQWGHKTGDQAIINVASLMLQSVRNVDLLSRAGTRTIMALFPNTDTEAAKIPLERMQKLIAENPMKWNNQEIPLHLIVGVATLDDTIHSASELIAVSQQAVDQARSLGQNSVDLLK